MRVYINCAGGVMPVDVWADGFGRWYAKVPNGGTVNAQRERARRAIAREVRTRQGGGPPVIRLELAPDYATKGHRVWRER